MSNVENIIVQQLQSLRNEIGSLKTAMHDEFKDVKHRLSKIEGSTLATRRDNNTTQEDVYRQQNTIDRLNERLQRIETRLEISQG
ncbi:MAG: hypothetical protein QM599_07375 [Pseudoxanthomonas sp.]